MKPRSLPLMLLAVAGLAVLWSRPAAAQLLSPGPLNQAHASVEGDDNCSNCHSSGKRVEASKCLVCHEDLGKRIQAQAGLHGRAYRGKACPECHVEHIGKSSRLVRWPGGDKTKLDHRLTGWALEGEHQRVQCEKCHNKKNSRGAATYLGLATTCASCHQDPHRGRFGTTCQECHSSQSWKSVKIENFDHDRTRFALKGKHRTVDCKKCHGEPARYRDLKFNLCSDCHKDPHEGRFKQACTTCHSESGWKDVEAVLRENHPGVQLVNGHKSVGCKDCHDRGNDRVPSKGTRCVSCHPAVHKADFGTDCKDCHGAIRWLGLSERVGRSSHPKTRYPLRGEHRDVACERCHSKNLPSAQRYRGIKFDQCNRCHDDRHRGEFASRNGGECAQCHTVEGFTPTLFGPELHATTRFALDGRHAATPCRGCHKGERPRLDLRIAKSACADCHANPHGTQFEAEMKLGGCAQCHSTVGWQNPKVDHAIWPLTGAHARTRCSSCHTPSAEDRASGRGATYRGVPRECDQCHQDQHAGQFRLSQPVRACNVCHQTSTFKIAVFDHERLAAYPLTGKHKSVACAKCHKPELLRNGGSAVRYRLGYRQCRDCHANPHRE